MSFEKKNTKSLQEDAVKVPAYGDSKIDEARGKHVSSCVTHYRQARVAQTQHDPDDHTDQN